MLGIMSHAFKARARNAMLSKGATMKIPCFAIVRNMITTANVLDTAKYTDN